MRDSASWDTLDKAIDRLGGTSAVNAAAAVNGSAAVVAAVAADVVSPGESDDDESTGKLSHAPAWVLQLCQQHGRHGFDDAHSRLPVKVQHRKSPRMHT